MEIECEVGKIDFKIVRITAICETGVPFDLNILKKKLVFLDYFPETFPACAYFKDPKLKGQITIWKSGTLSAIAKTQEDAKTDISYTISRLTTVLKEFNAER